MYLQLPQHQLSLNKAIIVGIVNITTDSFADGGKFLDADKAVAQAMQLASDGADIIDLGAESTRPNSQAISSDLQLQRIMPVLEKLEGKLTIPISIDTSSAEVIKQVATTQVAMINDVAALTHKGALEAVANTKLAICLMHMQKTPANMQNNPVYDDVVAEVQAFLQTRVQVAEQAGINLNRIAIDPGFGFGKSLEHNLILLNNLSKIRVSNLPIYVGISRKSMLGTIIGEDNPNKRLSAGIAAAVLAFMRGATFIRTHDVKATLDALKVISMALEN